MAKLFITKKQKERYSQLWEKVNSAPVTEADEKAGYPPKDKKDGKKGDKKEDKKGKGKDGKKLPPWLNKKKSNSALSQEEAIDYSCKIIGALRQKQKDHNSEFNTKAQFSKIKEAYRRGANLRPKGSEKTCNQWGMANVNALLDKSEELNFEKADQDIKKYNLKAKFDNLEDLYLEEYSPINKVY
jgi:hypothetical protein